MNRRWIYYLLTGITGASFVAGILTSQFVLVSDQYSWSGKFGWELVFVGWGSLCYAMGCIFLSFLSDKYGRLKCISISLLLIALANAMMGFKVLGEFKVWHFLLYWTICNLCHSVFFPGIEALLSESQDHTVSVARRIGAYCLSWSVCDALSAFVTGNAKEIFGPEIIYRSIFIVCFSSFFIVLWDWYRHGSGKIGDTGIGTADIRPEAPFHARLGRIGLFFGCVAFASITAIFPRFARDYHQLSEGQTGNLISTILTIGTCMFFILPRWKRWHYNTTVQIILQAPMFLGLILIIFCPVQLTIMIRAGLALFGFGWASSYYFSIYYSLLVPGDHAKSGGIHESALGMGNFSGQVSAFILVWLIGKTMLFSPQRLGVTPIIFGFCFVLISLTIQMLLIKKHFRTKT